MTRLEILKQSADALQTWLEAPLGQKPKIEYHVLDSNGNLEANYNWHSISTPAWDMQASAYRISPAKLAEGHNPDKLTEEQVGVKDGWRLLGMEEVSISAVDFPETQWWRDGEWSDTWCYVTSPYSCTLRTQKPPGYYLSKAEIAEGHNPAKLTVDQIPAGRRLMTREEVARGAQAIDCSKRQNIWVWFHKSKTWSDVPRIKQSWEGNTLSVTYCVPLGWQDPLLKKKVRKPCGPEHFPQGTVVRGEHWERFCFSEVQTRTIKGIGILIGANSSPSFIPFEDMEPGCNSDHFMRSLDGGRTWLPCYIETEE